MHKTLCILPYIIDGDAVIGKYVLRARKVHIFFEKFKTETNVMEDEVAKSARTLRLPAIDTAEERLRNLWNTKFKRAEDQDAFKHPPPSRKTVEQALSDLINQVTVLQASVASLANQLAGVGQQVAVIVTKIAPLQVLMGVDEEDIPLVDWANEAVAHRVRRY